MDPEAAPEAVDAATELSARLEAALACEIARTQAEAARSAAEAEALPGVIALASASVAYGGPLTGDRRVRLERYCIAELMACGFPDVTQDGGVLARHGAMMGLKDE